MKGSDLAIALAGGAASGFLEDAARENKDAKLMQEKERELAGLVPEGGAMSLQCQLPLAMDQMQITLQKLLL